MEEIWKIIKIINIILPNKQILDDIKIITYNEETGEFINE